MKKLLSFMFATVLFASCGGNTQSQQDENAGLTNINAVENNSANVNSLTQALPTIMVIPSDQC